MYAVEAERALIGSVLNNQDVLPSVIDLVSTTDFTAPNHRTIWSTIVTLFEDDLSIDPVSVWESISSDGYRGSCTASYLVEISSVVGTTMMAEKYAQKVAQAARRRVLIKVMADLTENLKSPGADLAESLNVLTKTISELTGMERGALIREGRDVILDGLARIKERQERKQVISGVQSGFHDIDSFTGGWQPSDLIILAGRPSMGKTALALQSCLNAVSDGSRALFFSLEMGDIAMSDRIISVLSGINQGHIKGGWISDEKKPILDSLRQRADSLPITIDYTPAASVGYVSRAARAHKIKHGLDLVVVDYLQLMRGRSTNTNREQEVASISRGLKAVAKELNVPVIALSQLNRSVEQRPVTDRKPKLSDLRESGSIEQDADLVIFLHREEFYFQTPQNKGKADIHLAKHRNGPTGSLRLGWDGQTTRFINLYE